MTTHPEETSQGPIELLESAKTKYQLAQARLRRGPLELALLSLHGAVEDVLRAHGLRLQLPAAYASFAQLLDALTATEQRPLSAAEAEGVRRMHRLRARVAHGEQIVVTRETIEAYQRLAARLLPRYGVLVIGGEGEAHEAARQPASTTTTMMRRELAEVPDELTALARRGDTARVEREPPRRERTVYPDGGSARYLGRARPSRATADLPLAREWAAERAGPGRAPRRGRGELWDQRWLLPTLAIISIFLIGVVISLSLQQLRAEPPVPTAVLPVSGVSGATSFAPQGGVVPAAEDGSGDEAALVTPSGAEGEPLSASQPPSSGPTAAPPGALAPGRQAYVRADAVALNVRARPGTAADNPEVFILAPGTAVEVIGGPVEEDGFTWWQVRSPAGEGWCAGQFLEVR